MQLSQVGRRAYPSCLVCLLCLLHFVLPCSSYEFGVVALSLAYCSARALPGHSLSKCKIGVSLIYKADSNFTLSSAARQSVCFSDVRPGKLNVVLMNRLDPCSPEKLPWTGEPTMFSSYDIIIVEGGLTTVVRGLRTTSPTNQVDTVFVLCFQGGLEVALSGHDIKIRRKSVNNKGLPSLFTRFHHSTEKKVSFMS